MGRSNLMTSRPYMIGLIGGLLFEIFITQLAHSESIKLKQSGGVYMLPVRINDTVTVPFVLDSGAAEVSIPNDVFSVLRRSDTINQSDFIGTGTYTLADGTTVSSDRYILHKMSLGDHIITDVVANVVSVKGDALLGQSFLQKLPAWTLDNAQHALVLEDIGEKEVEPQTAARAPAPPPTRRAPAPTTPHAPPVPAGISLQEIFNDEMMHIQVPFLESRVGPARRVSKFTSGEIRTYTIQGCDVTAYTKENEVVGYGLVLGGHEPWRTAKPNCNIEIPRSDKHLRTNSLTIGKFINSMGPGIGSSGSFLQSGCLTMCGNATDPRITYRYDGPHSTGWMHIDLDSIIAYDASIDAAHRWANLMTQREGQMYVVNTTFNCDEKYDKVGLQLFWNIEVYEITIGSNLSQFDPCGGRTSK
jgi:hypothetical protein